MSAESFCLFAYPPEPASTPRDDSRQSARPLSIERPPFAVPRQQVRTPHNMATYQFYLESFTITDTRSHHKDTLVAGFGVVVNSTIYGPLSAQLGDFNNGEYVFWQHGLGAIDNVPIKASDNVALLYHVYNNGKGGLPDIAALSAELRSRLVDVGKSSQETQLARSRIASEGKTDSGDAEFPPQPYFDDGFWTGEDGRGGDPTLVRNIFTAGLYSIIKYSYQNCDGPVAFGWLWTTGSALEKAIAAAPGQPLRTTKTTNAKALGLNSPCNSSGSNYIIKTIIQRRD
jgi:hypothetical protein